MLHQDNLLFGQIKQLVASKHLSHKFIGRAVENSFQFVSGATRK